MRNGNMTKSDLDEDIATSERLHTLMQRVIATRSDVTDELMDPRWKELRRENARQSIADAEKALNEALRWLNTAVESERKLSAARYIME